MNSTPIIERELRAESRRPVNFWLRVVAASSLVVVFTFFALEIDVDLSHFGALLFGTLHTTLLIALWMIVPLMTADCLSSEKREGTLGLLFLTPLKTKELIMGKAVTHAIRAFTLFLSAAPILGLPFFLGGVTSPMVLASITAQANAVLLGIAAGLFASAGGGSTIRVMILAEIYAVALAFFSNIWISMFQSRTRAIWPSLFAQCVTLLFSFIAFRLILAVSAGRLEQSWQTESGGHEQPKWVKLFSESQFWQSFFQWDKSRTLSHNPIAWLQEYSWTARLTKWGWFAGTLIAEFFLFTSPEIFGWYHWLPCLISILGLGLAFSAVWSFRREQQTGLLELLMVTPLSVRQILYGRIWGIFAHFFPAVAVLSLGLLGDRMMNPKLYDRTMIGWLLPNPLAFISIIVLGLHMALTRLNVIVAWLITWVGAFLLPVTLAVVLVSSRMPTVAVHTLSTIAHLMIISSFWLLLYQKVDCRAFVLAK